MRVLLMLFLLLNRVWAEEWREEVRISYDEGLRWLVDNQNDNGSWGGSQWTGGVDSDPVPGAFQSFDVAVTAMCLEAIFPLREQENFQEAVQKATNFLKQEFPQLRRPHPRHLPNIWGYCYGIQVLAKIVKEAEEEEEKWAREEMKRLMKGLELFEVVGGGWFYYANSATRTPDAPSASFVNAAVLVALWRAKEVGVEIDEKLVARALKATLLQRKPDSSYLYSARTPLDRRAAMKPINRKAGSLGRSQAGNYALYLWGEEAVTSKVMTEWIGYLLDRQGWLDMGRKRPIPHESHAEVAGYFYYFGHYYGALCLSEIQVERRSELQKDLAGVLTTRQEEDGSWFDYPLYSYHKPYGTAFAVMSLRECLKGKKEGE